jgi:1,4-alpha-glucan branching enzyme
MGAPLKTSYIEIFNSDAEKYGGSNVLNTKPILSEDIPMHEKPYSMTLRIPPLGTVVLRPEFDKDKRP